MQKRTMASCKNITFKWQRDVEAQLDSCIGDQESKKLQQATYYLFSNANKEVELCISKGKFKRARRLYNVLKVFTVHIHLKREQISTDVCQPTIKDLVLSILSFLLDLQLFLSRSPKTIRPAEELSNQIVQDVLLFAGTHSHALWEVLLQSSLLKQKHFRLLSASVLARLISASPWKIKQEPENYLKCLLCLRLWHTSCLPEQRSKVMKMALQAPVPKKLSHWLKAHPITGLPKLTKKQQPILFIDHFLKKTEESAVDQLIDILSEDLPDENSDEPAADITTNSPMEVTTKQLFVLDRSRSNNFPVQVTQKTDALFDKIQSELEELPPFPKKLKSFKSRPDKDSIIHDQVSSNLNEPSTSSDVPDLKEGSCKAIDKNEHNQHVKQSESLCKTIEDASDSEKLGKTPKEKSTQKPKQKLRQDSYKDNVRRPNLGPPTTDSDLIEDASTIKKRSKSSPACKNERALLLEDTESDEGDFVSKINLRNSPEKYRENPGTSESNREDTSEDKGLIEFEHCGNQLDSLMTVPPALITTPMLTLAGNFNSTQNLSLDQGGSKSPVKAEKQSPQKLSEINASDTNYNLNEARSPSDESSDVSSTETLLNTSLKDTSKENFKSPTKAKLADKDSVISDSCSDLNSSSTVVSKLMGKTDSAAGYCDFDTSSTLKDGKKIQSPAKIDNSPPKESNWMINSSATTNEGLSSGKQMESNPTSSTKKYKLIESFAESKKHSDEHEAYDSVIRDDNTNQVLKCKKFLKFNVVETEATIKTGSEKGMNLKERDIASNANFRPGNESETIDFLNQPTQEYVQTRVPASDLARSSSNDSNPEITALDFSSQTHLTSDEEVVGGDSTTLNKKRLELMDSKHEFQRSPVKCIVDFDEEASRELFSSQPDTKTLNLCEDNSSEDFLSPDSSSQVSFSMSFDVDDRKNNSCRSKRQDKFESKGTASTLRSPKTSPNKVMPRTFESLIEENSQKKDLADIEHDKAGKTSSNVTVDVTDKKIVKGTTGSNNSPKRTSKIREEVIQDKNEIHILKIKPSPAKIKIKSPVNLSAASQVSFRSPTIDFSDTEQNTLPISHQKIIQEILMGFSEDECEIETTKNKSSSKKTGIFYDKPAQEQSVPEFQFPEYKSPPMIEKKSPTQLSSERKRSKSHSNQELSPKKCKKTLDKDNVKKHLEFSDSDALILESDSTFVEDEGTPRRKEIYNISPIVKLKSPETPETITSKVTSQDPSNGTEMESFLEDSTSNVKEKRNTLVICNNDEPTVKKTRLSHIKPTKNDDASLGSRNILNISKTNVISPVRRDLEIKSMETHNKILDVYLQQYSCSPTNTPSRIVNTVQPFTPIASTNVSKPVSTKKQPSQKPPFFEPLISPNTPNVLESTAIGFSSQKPVNSHFKRLTDVDRIESNESSDVSSTETLLNTSLKDTSRENFNSPTKAKLADKDSVISDSCSDSDSDVSGIVARNISTFIKPNTRHSKSSCARNDSPGNNPSDSSDLTELPLIQKAKKKATVILSPLRIKSTSESLPLNNSSDSSDSTELPFSPKAKEKATVILSPFENKQTTESLSLNISSQKSSDSKLSSHTPDDMVLGNSNCMTNFESLDKQNNSSSSPMIHESRLESPVIDSKSSEKQKTPTAEVAVQTVLHSRHIAMLTPPIKSRLRIRKNARKSLNRSLEKKETTPKLAESTLKKQKIPPEGDTFGLRLDESLKNFEISPLNVSKNKTDPKLSQTTLKFVKSATEFDKRTSVLGKRTPKVDKEIPKVARRAEKSNESPLKLDKSPSKHLESRASPSDQKKCSVSSPAKDKYNSDFVPEAMQTRSSPLRMSLAYRLRPRVKTPRK